MRTSEIIVITRPQLRVLLMASAKAYQELVEHYGEEHARAIPVAASVVLDGACGPPTGSVPEYQPGRGGDAI